MVTPSSFSIMEAISISEVIIIPSASMRLAIFEDKVVI